MNSIVGLAVWCSMLVAAPVAVATTITTFNDSLLFHAAMGTPTFALRFDGGPSDYSSGPPVAGTSFDSRIAFRSPEAADPSIVIHWSGGISDAPSLQSSTKVGPVEGVFLTPASAFALELASGSTLATIELYGVAGNLLGTAKPALPNGFFGIHSDTAIARWIIRNGIHPGNFRDRFRIDDFQAVVVPEPSAQAIWALTIALTAYRSSRRLKSQMK